MRMSWMRTSSRGIIMAIMILGLLLCVQFLPQSCNSLRFVPARGPKEDKILEKGKGDYLFNPVQEVAVHGRAKQLATTVAQACVPRRGNLGLADELKVQLACFDRTKSVLDRLLRHDFELSGKLQKKRGGQEDADPVMGKDGEETIPLKLDDESDNDKDSDSEGDSAFLLLFLEMAAKQIDGINVKRLQKEDPDTVIQAKVGRVLQMLMGSDQKNLNSNTKREVVAMFQGERREQIFGLANVLVAYREFVKDLCGPHPACVLTAKKKADSKIDRFIKATERVLRRMGENIDMDAGTKNEDETED